MRTTSSTPFSSQSEASPFAPAVPAISEIPNTQTPEGSTLGNSLARGVDQLQASLYAATNAIGELAGFDAMAEWGIEGFQRNMEEITANPPEMRDWDDVDSWADFGTYVLERLGEQAPNIATDITAAIGGFAVGTATTGVGGVAGAAAAGKARRVALARFGKAVKRKVGEKGFSHAQKNIAGRVGASTALTGSMVAQGVGETQGEFIHRGIQAPEDAVIAGTIKGLIDRVGFDKVMGLARTTGRHPVALIKNTLKASGTEATTESIQATVDLLAIKANDPDFDLLSVESAKTIRESFIVGGIVGGALGGAASAIAPTTTKEGNPIEDDNPIPESQEVVDAQAKAVADPTSKKDTIQITKGSPLPSDGILPEESFVVDTKNGPVITTSATKADDIVQNGGDQASIGRALYNQDGGKVNTDGTTVVARNAEGVPVSEFLTNQQDLDRALESGREQAPNDGSVEVTTIDKNLTERLDRLDNEEVNTPPDDGLSFHDEQIEGINLTPLDRDIDHLRSRLKRSKSKFKDNVKDDVSELEILYPLHEFTVTPEDKNGTKEFRAQARPRLFDTEQDANVYAEQIEEVYRNSIFTPIQHTDGRFRLIEETTDTAVAPEQNVSTQDRAAGNRGNTFSETERSALAVVGAQRQAKRIRRMGRSKKPGAKNKAQLETKKIISAQDPEGFPVEFSLPAITTLGLDLNRSDTQQNNIASASLDGLSTGLAKLGDLGYTIENDAISQDAIIYDDGSKQISLADVQQQKQTVQEAKEGIDKLEDAQEQTYENRTRAFTRIDALKQETGSPESHQEISALFEVIEHLSEKLGKLPGEIQKQVARTVALGADKKSLSGKGANTFNPSSTSKKDVETAPLEDRRRTAYNRDGFVEPHDLEDKSFVEEGQAETDIEENAKEAPRTVDETTGERITTSTKPDPEFIKPTREEYLRFGIDPDKLRVLSKPIPEGKAISQTEAKKRVNQFFKGIDPSFDGKTFRGLEILVVEKNDTFYSNVKGAIAQVKNPKPGQSKETLVIISDNHTADNNFEGIEATLRHEVLAHFGATKLLTGADKQQLINALRASRRSLKEGWDYVEQNYSDKPPNEQAEEVFAYYAERLPENSSTWDRIVNIVVRALRRLGVFANKMTKQDLNNILRAIKKGLGENPRSTVTEGRDKTVSDILSPGDNAVLAKRGFETIKNLLSDPKRTGALAVLTLDGQLRLISPDLADLIYQPTNTVRGGDKAYWTTVSNSSKEWIGRLNKILNGYDRAKQNEAMVQLAQEEDTKDLSPLAAKLRSFISEEFHSYLGERSPLLKDRRIKKYFPRAYDTGAIESDQDRFISILKDHDVEDPVGILESILSTSPRDVFKNDSFLSRMSQFEKVRILKEPGVIKALYDAGFMQQDPAGALISYLHSAVKRAEFEGLFGGCAPIRGLVSNTQLEKAPKGPLRQAIITQNKRAITRFALKTDFLPSEFHEARDTLFDLEKQLFAVGRTDQRQIKKQINETLDQTSGDVNNILLGLQEKNLVSKDANNNWVFYDHAHLLKERVESDPKAQEHIKEKLKGLSGAEAKIVKQKELSYIHRLLSQSIEDTTVDRDSPLYQAMGELRAYLSFVYLAFSGVASIPEIASVATRLKGSLPTKEVGGILKDITTHYKEHSNFAEDLGVVVKGTSIAIQQDLYGAGSQTDRGVIRRHLPKLFKYNGNDFIVNYTSVFAVESAKQAILKSARDQTKFDKRFLEELGVTPEQVKTWSSLGHTTTVSDVVGTEFEHDVRAVNNAITQFTDEAMLKPTPSDRTIWAEHPIGGLFFHLKSFAYKFQRNVTQGVYRELKNRSQARDASTMQTIAWVSSVLAMYLFLGAVSDELRERIKSGGEKGTLDKNPTWGKAFRKYIDRSGLTSIPWTDVLLDPSLYSASYTAGPTFSHLHMLLSDVRGDKDLVEKVMKSTPVFSQVPELRKQVYQLLE